MNIKGGNATLARVHINIWRIQLELTEEETQKMLDASDLVSTLMGFGVFFPPPGNVVVAAFATYIRLNKWIISKVDKGNGVRLTRPHVPGWLIIPAPL